MLEFAGYLRGPFAIDQVAANSFLLFGQVYCWMFEGCFGHIFQSTILITFIIIEVDGGEEPTVNNAHPWYTSFFHEVHKMPVTEVKLPGCFMCGQHTIEVLQVVVYFITSKSHLDTFLRDAVPGGSAGQIHS